MDDVMCTHNGRMARHVYFSVDILHDKHNSRDSDKIPLNVKDQKYSS